MAYVTKRKTDKSRGKGGKWTCWYVGPDGKKRSKAGTTDKAESQRMADRLEADATLVREGLLDPAEKARRASAIRPAVEHVEDYRIELESRANTAKHVIRVVNALKRLLALARIASVADLSPDRIRAAVGRLTDASRAGGPDKLASARTKNFYLVTIKSFANWLHDCDRIEHYPKGIRSLKPYNEKEDRRLIRRALTVVELARLLEATEAGPTIEAGRGPRSEGRVEAHVRYLTGLERATLYRLAMGTGFRANELRTLTPESFKLDGQEPIIILDPKIEKNRKGVEQPITRELASSLKPFVEGKPPGKPVLAVPDRAAKMLRADLARAGIAFKDAEGRVVDFHALRGSYITHLIMAKVNPKIVQTLARHSTITLTLDRYTTLDRSDARKALEGER